MKIKFILKKDYFYYMYLQRFILHINTETFLPTCLMRIRIVEVKTYSLYLEESSNDKPKMQDQVSACLGGWGEDRQKVMLYKSSYIKFC